jgi:hypothetical protein
MSHSSEPMRVSVTGRDVTGSVTSGEAAKGNGVYRPTANVDRLQKVTGSLHSPAWRIRWYSMTSAGRWGRSAGMNS